MKFSSAREKLSTEGQKKQKSHGGVKVYED